MRHLDEARGAALEILRKELTGADAVRAVLIDDLFGQLRLILWGAPERNPIRTRILNGLGASSEPFWRGAVLDAEGGAEADSALAQRAWDEASGDEELPHQLRILDRHRNRGWWFEPVVRPPWSAEEAGAGSPPIISFYSFKGGVGRTTALSSFAVQRARAGERVVIVDGDLDAPGVGGLFWDEEAGTSPRWGLTDYLLERQHGEVDLGDYLYASRSEALVGSGEISVLPVGRLDDGYLRKLARVDLEPTRERGGAEILELLVRQIHEERKPDWILIDSRAGLADPAGALLGGLAHLIVLFGTSAEASWAGLRIVLGRLGRARLRRGVPQADCLLVHGMVTPRASEVARRSFTDRARDEYDDVYYAAEPDHADERCDEIWYLGDAESSDAPHVPTALHYNELLAFFDRLSSVAGRLAEDPDYVALAERIVDRFGRRAR